MTIRTRLALVYAAALAATLVLIGGLVWWQMGNALRSSLETALKTRAAAVATSLENNGQAGLQESDAQVPGVFAAIFDAHGQLIDASSTAPSGLMPQGGVTTLVGQRYLVAVQPATGGVQIVTGADLADVERTQADLARSLVLAGLLLGLASLGAVWLLAGQALRPVERLAAEAAALRPSDLGRRLRPPHRADEVGRLTETLNAMLDRIEESVDRQRLFVAMASHELRTPLTALRVELELVDRPGVTEKELRGALRAAGADAIRLTNLSDALLELAVSADEKQRLARRWVPLQDVTDAAVRATEGLAAQRGVAFSRDVPGDASVWLDPRRIEQAIGNLLANAVLHGAEQGTVVLHARLLEARPAQTLEVQVLDRGPGLDGESAAELFSPFRRGRRARLGGAGLGLAMVAAAIDAHGGTYGGDDRPGGGARFWFSVPCAPEASESALEPGQRRQVR